MSIVVSTRTGGVPLVAPEAISAGSNTATRGPGRGPPTSRGPPYRPRSGSSPCHVPQSRHDRFGRRASGNLEVDRDDVPDRSEHLVTAGERTAIVCAVIEGDNPFGMRHRLESLPERTQHVSCDRPGHEEHIRVARGRDQPDAIPFHIMHRSERGVDLDPAPVAGPSIDMANLDRCRRQECFQRALDVEPPGRGSCGLDLLGYPADPAEVANETTTACAAVATRHGTHAPRPGVAGLPEPATGSVGALRIADDIGNARAVGSITHQPTDEQEDTVPPARRRGRRSTARCREQDEDSTLRSANISPHRPSMPRHNPLDPNPHGATESAEVSEGCIGVVIELSSMQQTVCAARPARTTSQH
ncbi:hypothetical protein E143388_08141 [Rhodococcus opacus]|nr:hypothetical protein E143388_08141 [Rhodococcus opacus]